MFAFFVVLVRCPKNPVFLIGPKSIKNLIKSIVGAQGTDTRRKTDPRLVYLDEGRDPGEGKPLPRVEEEGLKPDKTPKPPQPEGLVGLSFASFFLVRSVPLESFHMNGFVSVFFFEFILKSHCIIRTIGFI